ncbi:MAG: septum formation protein Maf [Verrucomicrobia bacterium]|jgi:septum formation protein|nr:septum formation protein Maf [Verrucomicrobiota bacterium]
MTEWILASASPRRHELLKRLGLSFRIVQPVVQEWEPEEADPIAQVRHNAQAKAAAVAQDFPAAGIIAADTTVALGKRLFAKPANLRHAREMLRNLSGRTHKVFTGVTLVFDGQNRSFHESSDVRFRALTEAEIEHYLANVHVFDKAGAYAIQDGGEWIVEHFTGSFENIMGLPLQRLRAELVELGMEGLPPEGKK